MRRFSVLSWLVATAPDVRRIWESKGPTASQVELSVWRRISGTKRYIPGRTRRSRISPRAITAAAFQNPRGRVVMPRSARVGAAGGRAATSVGRRRRSSRSSRDPASPVRILRAWLAAAPATATSPATANATRLSTKPASGRSDAVL